MLKETASVAEYITSCTVSVRKIRIKLIEVRKNTQKNMRERFNFLIVVQYQVKASVTTF